MHCTASIIVGLLGIGTGLLPAGASQAANCTVTATSVAFGNYDPLSATPRNRSGRISVACNGNGTFTVALSTGQSGAYNPRYMLSAATSDRLDYNLYTSAARSIVFGDGTGGTQTVSKGFRNNTKTVTVFGQIPAMENISAGTYSDSIVATVTF